MATAASIFVQITKNKKKLKEYQKRVESLSRSKGIMSAALPPCVEAINNKIENCMDDLGQGIKLSGGQPPVIDEIGGKKEKAPTGDGSLSGTFSSVTKEITRCNSKITELNNKIARLQSDYKKALQAEKAEKEEKSNKKK